MKSNPDSGRPADVYVCVDVEASGPIPNPYNLVSVGAVVVHQPSVGAKSAGARPAGAKWTVRDGRPFYVELKPLYPGFDDHAMSIHGIPKEHLERAGVEPAAAMRQLAAFALDAARRPVFVGHNAVFDWAYVNHYFHVTNVPNPFGWKALDTKSLAAGVLGIPFLETAKENLARLLPQLGSEDLALRHRADADAAYQGRLLAVLLNLVPAIATDRTSA